MPSQKIVKRYDLTPLQEEAVLAYLDGEITAQALGDQLGRGRQSTTNLVTCICRQWYAEGKLKFITNPPPKDAS